MVGGSSIAAIATARGESALSIVRVSGPEAVPIASRVFAGSAELSGVDSHTAWFGRVSDADGHLLDEVVATVFRAPRSSTGEDVVELTCHGGDTVPAAVLSALLDAGATPAAPGEFTRRAFLNGKLDLDQAEAVMDLIHSRSSAAHRASARQLQGRLKRRLSELRSQLLKTCGLVELELDFGEEDVEFADRREVVKLLSTLRQTVEEMLGTASVTDRWRDGILVVLAGRPNAGKSTLLNALVGSDRVIVSSTPGTTRDFIESHMELDGLLLRLTDTAGIRTSSDEIESEGVRRTEALIASADVLLYVFDSSEPLSDREIQLIQAQNGENGAFSTLLVANKADLLTDDLSRDLSCFPASLESAGLAMLPAVSVSAKLAVNRPEELEALLEAIRAVLPPALRDFDSSDGMINERHQRHLEDARSAISRTEHLIASGSGGELLSLELRSALEAIGLITGQITNEDILTEIFSRFCIGK
ncbi:MAG: tRNA modification GTPase [Rhodothermales bacterium]